MLSSSLHRSFSQLRDKPISIDELISLLYTYEADWIHLHEREIIPTFRPVSRRIKLLAPDSLTDWDKVLPKIQMLKNPILGLDILVCFLQTLKVTPPSTTCQKWYALSLDPRILRFYPNMPMPDSQEIDPNVLSHRWFEYHLMQWNRNGGAWPYSNSNPAPPRFLAQVLRHGRIEPCVVQDLMKLPNDSLSGLIQGENISRVVWRFLCESSEQVLLEVGYPAVVRLLDCLWQAVLIHKKIPRNCFQSLIRLQNMFHTALPGPDLSLVIGKSKLTRLAPILDSLIPGYEY